MAKISLRTVNESIRYLPTIRVDINQPILTDGYDNHSANPDIQRTTQKRMFYRSALLTHLLQDGVASPVEVAQELRNIEALRYNALTFLVAALEVGHAHRVSGYPDPKMVLIRGVA